MTHCPWESINPPGMSQLCVSAVSESGDVLGSHQWTLQSSPVQSWPLLPGSLSAGAVYRKEKLCVIAQGVSVSEIEHSQ